MRLCLYVDWQGAFWGTVAAQVIGLIRFVLDNIYPTPACGALDNRPSVVAMVHPYYFSMIQMALCAILAMVISYVTEPIPR